MRKEMTYMFNKEINWQQLNCQTDLVKESRKKLFPSNSFHNTGYTTEKMWDWTKNKGTVPMKGMIEGDVWRIFPSAQAHTPVHN